MIVFPTAFYKVSDSFSPTDISNGIYWIDATDSSQFTLNSGNISAITDKFGVNDWEQTTALNQPPYVSGQYIDFNDASNLNTTTTVDLSTNNKTVTIAMVLTSNEDISADNGIILESSSNYNSINDGFVINAQSTNSRIVTVYRDSGYQADKIGEPSDFSWGTKTSFIFVIDKSEAVKADKIKIFVNGVELSSSYLTTSAGIGTLGDYTHYLGARGASLTAPMLGEMYEVIGYNKALTSDEVSQLNTYLMNKHSI